MTKIIDVCCGSRMMWFDKEDERATFCDKRQESHILCDGRALNISPDIVCDFTDLPFEDDSFSLVVFDPPHLKAIGASSWTAKKYGSLSDNWQQVISDGFSECFRVLKKDGVLIFKWCEHEIPTKKILECTLAKPMFGHRSGKRSNTHWVTFMKGSA